MQVSTTCNESNIACTVHVHDCAMYVLQFESQISMTGDFTSNQ
jgi:hypothetical protein